MESIPNPVTACTAAKSLVPGQTRVNSRENEKYENATSDDSVEALKDEVNTEIDVNNDFGNEVSMEVLLQLPPGQDGDGVKPINEESGLEALKVEVKNEVDVKEDFEDVAAMKVIEKLPEQDGDDARCLDITEQQSGVIIEITGRMVEQEAEENHFQQRYERLQTLLGKSKFYTEYLVQKIQRHAAAMKLKEQTQMARERKIASNKRKISEIEDKEGKAVKKPGFEIVSGERKYEGEVIPRHQPLLLTGGIMRNYQLEGLLWMTTLWHNGINGVLADEMGLGKTIQTVALLCHMYEMGVTGPFLIVAPLSTLANWVLEFRRFAPKVPCILYHGNRAEREILRDRLEDSVTCDETDGREMMNVVVTSFEIAMNDRVQLQDINWDYIVVDEAHRIKNTNSKLIKELKQYHSVNRLLLTGTPLQNDLSELWSLFNFLLPEIFDDQNVFESWFNAKDLHEDGEERKRVLAQEQHNSILATLHQILTPFLLRRVKADVDLQIPPKKELLVYCPLSEIQKEMYRHTVEKTIETYLIPNQVKEEILPEKRQRRDIDYSVFLDDEEYADEDKFNEHLAKISEQIKEYKSHPRDNMERNQINPKNTKYSMMDLRKVVNHPYLIQSPVTGSSDPFYTSHCDIINVCGKLTVLHQMLAKLIANGHKTLVFSQMTNMLDILEDYLDMQNIDFCRLDGSTKLLDRQENIDRFNSDPEVAVFLLSTRAGGLGINLTGADTCIIYDSDWNPQQDLQAQNRCHRIGQTKPVMIYRLVTANTIDEKMVERAAAKRKLEKMIIHKDKFKHGAENIATSLKSLSPAELLALLHSKDHDGAVSAGSFHNKEVFTEEQLQLLLDRSDLVWGEKETKQVKETVNKVEGFFTVISNKSNLGSITQ